MLEPAAGLIEASDGYLYGTTKYGCLPGTSDLGNVYRMTPSGYVSNVHYFHGDDGSGPMGELLQASDGYLYGTASGGGEMGFGSVFRLTTSGTFTLMYSFAGGADGSGPRADLVEGPDGALYSTTRSGGSYGKGTVFRMTKAGALTTLHSFDGTDGQDPRSVVFGGDGYLYGVAYGGGSSGGGTIFRCAPLGGCAALHSFSGPDGKNPVGTLLPLDDYGEQFVGVTTYGGECPRSTFGCGTVFRVTVARSNLRVAAIKAPAAVASGATFSVTDTTKNEGPATSDSSHTGLWLSTNKTRGADDVWQGGRPVPGLAVGESHKGAIAALAPATVGIYYLIAEADTHHAVVETSEFDNLKVKVLTVGPDLYVSKLVFTLDPPTRTGSTIAVTTRNKGGDGVPAGTKTRVYLSANSKFEPTDTLLHTHTVPALGPGAASTSAFSPTLPGGTWYFIVVVDADNLVVEAKEGTANQKKLKRTVP